VCVCVCLCVCVYRCADKSLALPGTKQPRKHVRDARDFNNMETRIAIKFLYLQSKTPKEIQPILTETLACFFPGRAKDLSAPLHTYIYIYIYFQACFVWKPVKRVSNIILQSPVPDSECTN